MSRIKRKPRTRAELLPLSNANIRALSLEVHVALAAVRSGQGGAIQVGQLAKANYVAFFLRDATPAGADVKQFQQAEGVIDRCIERAWNIGTWTLPEEDVAVLERMLKLYDAQLEAVPAYRLAEAWGKFQRAMVDSLRCPVNPAETEKLQFTIGALRSQMS